ncbi:hypothetical protein TNCV_2943021 [Trichonephila clavipes]|nr:hypothetical protein TNCV_2943021 [Trichonephila clavipes]
MRYDRALSHTSSVCLETFHSIFAVTLPLARSNSWDAQLAVQNDPIYAQLKTNLLGRAMAKKVLTLMTLGKSCDSA